MSRKTEDELDAVLRTTAERKARASALRFAARDPEAEPAREVYLQCCARIGEFMAPLGFRYARSTQRCSREAGDFTQVVSFQSSHHNVTGHHVCLWMHADVRSKRLLRWREARFPGSRMTDHVAGGMVHRLRGVHAMIEWELADRKTRDETLDDIVSFIHAEVLPYFQRFEDPATLVEELGRQEVGAFDLQASVEFAACFVDRSAAQRVLDRFVRERPDLAEAISAAEQRPMPLHGPSSYAETIAHLRRVLELR